MAVSGDLTTTSFFRDVTGLTTTQVDEVPLGKLITIASDDLKAITGRTFIAAIFRESISGYNSRRLYLKEYPIINVWYVTDNTVDALRLKYTAGDASLVTVEVEERTSLVLKKQVSGTDSTTPLAFSTYTTLSSLVTAINAVTGWEAERLTAAIEYQDPRRLIGFECGDAEDNWITIETIDTPMTDYHVEAAEGWLQKDIGIWYSGRKNYHVLYQAGYGSPSETDAGKQAAALPENLQHLVCDMVLHLYHTRKRDRLVRSERLGDYAVAFGDVEATSFRGSHTGYPLSLQNRMGLWTRDVL